MKSETTIEEIIKNALSLYPDETWFKLAGYVKIKNGEVIHALTNLESCGNKDFLSCNNYLGKARQ